MLSQQVRTAAIQAARTLIEQRPVYLDTETTGLKDRDEIVEIAIIDHDGAVLLDELVKPSRKIPSDAQRIHGINDEMVFGKRAWPILWETTVRAILSNRVIAIYNASFDLRMMRQSFSAHGMTPRIPEGAVDVLDLYARYYGEMDPYRRGYRFQSLENARRQCGLSMPNAHRALEDALLVRELLHYMAAS